MHARIFTLLVVLLLIASCTGDTQRIGESPSTDNLSISSDIHFALPELPAGREPLGLKEHLINGSEFYEKSEGAAIAGTSLVLPGVAGNYNWAIYAFDTQGKALDSINVVFDASPGHMVWTAVSDYADGHWAFIDESDKGVTLAVDPARHVSPAGIIFIALITEGGSVTTVHALSVRTINPANVPPTAAFEFSTIDGVQPPFNVTFNAGASEDADGTISHYLWDFDGDGTFDGYTLTDSATHIYAEGGTYNPAVAAIDDLGGAGETSQELVLNIAPVASLVVLPSKGGPGEALTADASASTDTEGPIVNFEWDIESDGNYEFETGTLATISGWHPEFPGVGALTVRVTDAGGGQATAKAEITTTGWTEAITVTEDSGLQYNALSDIVIVQGRPAFAYGVQTSGGGNEVFDLRYTTALDEAGTQWAAPALVLDTVAGKINGVSLLVVNGRPAVLYGRDTLASVDDDLYQLTYILAADAGGENWLPRVSIGVNGIPGRNSLHVVQGMPAACYWHNFSYLAFIPALDPYGLSPWDMPYAIDGTQSGWEQDLILVDGRPAVAYSAQDGASQIRYSRAENAAGTDWPDDPLVLASDSFGVAFPKLAIVDDCPALLYYHYVSDELRYRRAQTPAGAEWSAYAFIGLAGGGTNPFPDLEVIDGVPATAFRDDSSRLRLVKALDSEGVDWGNGQVIGTSPSGGISSQLLLIDGRTTVAHFDIDAIKYVMHVRY
jgi:PKD repeat protein